MSDDSLVGCVSKVPLFVLPQFASNHELLECIRYKLHEYGFVTVCEEHRLINIETARKICQGMPNTVNTSHHDDKSNGEQACVLLCNMEPSLLVGRCYVFVLARSNCFDKITKMVEVINYGASTSVNAIADNDNKCSNDINKIKGNTVNVDNDEKKEIEDNNLKLIHLLAYGHQKSSIRQRTNDNKLPIVWTTTTSIDARHAVSLLFPQLLSEDIPTSAQSREYVQAHLKQALLPALTELCKTKPQEPIRWLAEKLLNTNTQAPPMISHDGY